MKSLENFHLAIFAIVALFIHTREMERSLIFRNDYFKDGIYLLRVHKFCFNAIT